MREAERLYREQLGEEKLEVQRHLAKLLHQCCGEWKTGPHHEGCEHYVPDEVPAVIDGQESLC